MAVEELADNTLDDMFPNWMKDPQTSLNKYAQAVLLQNSHDTSVPGPPQPKVTIDTTDDGFPILPEAVDGQTIMLNGTRQSYIHKYFTLNYGLWLVASRTLS